MSRLYPAHVFIVTCIEWHSNYLPESPLALPLTSGLGQHLGAGQTASPEGQIRQKG